MRRFGNLYTIYVKSSFEKILSKISSFILAGFYDFEILFNEINSAALVEMWPKINVKFATLTPFNEAVNVDYDDQLQDFLVFMKTFPSYHYRFMSSLNALFVFCEVSLGFL